MKFVAPTLLVSSFLSLAASATEVSSVCIGQFEDRTVYQACGRNNVEAYSIVKAYADQAGKTLRKLSCRKQFKACE